MTKNEHNMETYHRAEFSATYWEDGNFLLDWDSFAGALNKCKRYYELPGPIRRQERSYAGFSKTYFVISEDGIVEVENRTIKRGENLYRHDMLHIHSRTGKRLAEIEVMLGIQNRVPFNSRAVEKMLRQEELEDAQKRLDELE